MLKKILLVLVVLFIVAQFVPRTVFPISNPGVDPRESLQAKARKMPPEVASILNRSCRDCHSNQTVWPWYSKVAPGSWLLSRDVVEGRGELNLSEWGAYTPQRAGRKLKEICEQVERGEMPLSYYTPLHPETKLSPAEVKAVCAWTRAEQAALAAR